ncbi:MAG: hypothetical protein H3C31_11830 [Brumimicrobium sp.]|nr:hypothetical protein [Brumimicrobium sp.]
MSTNYVKVETIRTMNMFNQEGIIPTSIHVPTNRDFLIHIINDDQISLDLENDDRLTILLDGELYLNQKMDIIISGDPKASENKKLDIYMTGKDEEFLLIGDIDLPVFYNDETQTQNSAYLWEDFRFEIDFGHKINSLYKNIILSDEDKLQFQFKEFPQLVSNSINKGDVLMINNLFISVNGTIYDFSGQYKIDKVDLTTDLINLDICEITLDISSNKQFVETIKEDSGGNYPYDIHNDGNSVYLLRNKPYFSLNKGNKINIIKQSNLDDIKDRYIIKKERL